MNKDSTPLENFMDLVNYLAKRVKMPRMSGKTTLEDAEMQKNIERIKIVEAALKEGEKNKKALEIFKRNCLLSQYPDGSYELAFTNKIQPRDEDVEILKEVLK